MRTTLFCQRDVGSGKECSEAWIVQGQRHSYEHSLDWHMKQRGKWLTSHWVLFPAGILSLISKNDTPSNVSLLRDTNEISPGYMPKAPRYGDSRLAYAAVVHIGELITSGCNNSRYARRLIGKRYNCGSSRLRRRYLVY